MAADLAVGITRLGKRYRIGARQDGHVTLRETLSQLGSTLLARRHSPDRRSPVRNSERDHIWALQDVTFDVRRGEVVGIIGRNGAGKSTLLKILSRITEPTAGYAEIHGRVASLLEVGTGFHPELTGRDNIYLNGAILGMKRAEIARNFDAIVAFAEVEQFLDTPVKHYSSGMYVRLAFAVAAHLEPDILLVDEVLAVGDAAFQKKCLGKMQDASRGGRTVLFVSHNTAAIASLCQRVIVFRSGGIAFDGAAAEGVRRYIAETTGDAALIWPLDQLPRERPHLQEVLSLVRVEAHPTQDGTFRVGEPLRFTITFAAHAPAEGVVLAFNLDDLHGTRLATVDTSLADLGAALTPGGTYTAEVTCAPSPLMPGYYLLSASLYSGSRWYDLVRHFGSFEIAALEHESQNYYPLRPGAGVIDLPSSWRLVSTQRPESEGRRAATEAAGPA